MPRQQPGEPYSRVSLEEAKQMLEQGGAAVIDVRRPDEYAAGHVKKALFIPVDDILMRMDELPEKGKLLFICAAGVRSGLACEMAAAMGVPSERLYNIEAGTPSWVEKGYPTSFGNEP